MTSERTKDRFLIIALHIVIIGGILWNLAGCATYQSINHVQTPPREWQGNNTAQVEFVDAEAVLFKCLDAGPAVACTRADHIVITNPCAYPDQPYSRLLCHELAHVNSWPSNHPDFPPPLPTHALQAMAHKEPQ